MIPVITVQMAFFRPGKFFPGTQLRVQKGRIACRWDGRLFNTFAIENVIPGPENPVPDLHPGHPFCREGVIAGFSCWRNFLTVRHFLRFPGHSADLPFSHDDGAFPGRLDGFRLSFAGAGFIRFFLLLSLPHNPDLGRF